ncbi:hypothetical protein OESDEN_05862 [Oesophagostomum dentatum]|uniref:DUF7596 domain-containing protein n=1 Tax=Oesophagostomum dentatum TaxID=61180 RepID=A0A0B1TDN6_OESDE|nr:hypothetical protein OESDEN_05862 [Oesophagostomum dentatum]
MLGSFVFFQKNRENRRLLPLYVQFHTVADARPAEAHLVDRLSENALGRFNLELKKNVTHDSFAESDSWRDEAGFIVADRNRFVYATYKTASLLPTLTPTVVIYEIVPMRLSTANFHDCGLLIQEGLTTALPIVKITKYNAKDLETLCDFDTSVCGFAREEAVEFVASNSTVFVAKGDGAIDGVIAGKGGRIFLLYAETMEIAHALIKHYILTSNLKQVSFFTREDVWECEPTSARRVHRRHTRTVPSSIKWNKVFALNMGFHIV